MEFVRSAHHQRHPTHEVQEAAIVERLGHARFFGTAVERKGATFGIELELTLAIARTFGERLVVAERHEAGCVDPAFENVVHLVKKRATLDHEADPQCRDTTHVFVSGGLHGAAADLHGAELHVVRQALTNHRNTRRFVEHHVVDILHGQRHRFGGNCRGRGRDTENQGGKWSDASEQQHERDP